MWRDKIPTGKAARLWLHSALLFAAMAAPFFLFEVWTASLVSVGVGVIDCLWWQVTLHLRNRDKPKRPVKIILLSAAYGVSVPAALYGLTLVLFAVWAIWAYRPFAGPGEAPAIHIGLTSGIAALVLPQILFLVLAPLLARKDGGAASRYLNGVRTRGLQWFHINWLSNTATYAGIFGLFGLIWVPKALHYLKQLHGSNSIVTVWDLVADFPALALALPVVVAALMLEKSLSSGWNSDDADRVYMDGATDAPLPFAGNRTFLGALVAFAYGATLFLNIYPFHLAVVASSAVSGAHTMRGTFEAMQNLLDMREADDWAQADFAEELNRLGYWTPDAPEAGLATLVEDPGQAFAETCTVRIAAGIIGPTSRQVAGGPSDSEAGGDVKICIAVACASPVSWSAPPALVLASSHASRSEYWQDAWYIDVFAEGRAAAPGGYCTTDGRLADTYQG